MDVTPEVPHGRQIVTGYGDGLIRVGGRAWRQPILVLPDITMPWPITDPEALTAESLSAVIGHVPRIEVLLVGLGRRFRPLPPAVREALRTAGIAGDAMDTGAACRTYSVLLAEDRRVAAALFPV
jgi:uncharacterized protein